MQVQSLHREDPLEEEMATHFSMLAWRVPLAEGPGGLQPMGSQRDMTKWLSTHGLSILNYLESFIINICWILSKSLSASTETLYAFYSLICYCLSHWLICISQTILAFPAINIILSWYIGLLWWLRGKKSACNMGDLSSMPGSGRSPGEGNSNPL